MTLVLTSYRFCWKCDLAVKTKKLSPIMLHGHERIPKHKLGLLNPAEELGNVSEACQLTGLSRETFYRYKGAAGADAVPFRPVVLRTQRSISTARI